jgi:AraC family ethanolamine operon transcriptional activator
MFSSHRLFRSVEEFGLAHLQQPLTVVRLCREFEVSERTLHYAFQQAVSMSPMAYFRAKRLHQVRQRLKSMDPRATTIHEVANAWGFWHPGEFAAAYQRQFGELPSATVARSAGEQMGC